MTELPAPLTPPDCDLRKYPYMPLDTVRLRDSGLALKASGDEFRAAVLLWCAAWHQQPAASLPDDDHQLAALCGYGRAVKDFQKIKEGAMQGFFRCADGRLYHPVVAEKALDAMRRQSAQRVRTEAARATRHRAHVGSDRRRGQSVTDTVTDTVTANVTENVTGRGTASVTENVTDVVAHSVTASKIKETKLEENKSSDLTNVRSAFAPSADLPPNGSSLPEKPDDLSFNFGVKLLVEQGLTRPEAGAFIGRLKKAHGELPTMQAVLAALEKKAAGQCPADLRGWLTAAAKARANGNTAPPREVERPYMGM